jgi:plastocyanin
MNPVVRIFAGSSISKAAAAVALLAPLLGAVGLAAFGAGCGGSKSAAPESAPVLQTALNPSGKPVDSSTAGSISGMIMLDGAPPKPRVLNMAAVQTCKKQHADNPATTEDVVPGDSGTLQNVVVYLKGDFSSYRFDVPQTPATLDQGGCQFLPHVVALMVGQALDVSSTDKVSHNVNAMAKTNATWNHTESANAQPYRQSFARPEVAIPVKCNIHPWMKAYIAVLDSPYFAVTGHNGTFTLKDVPPGTYTLTAWHEAYGTQEQSITIGPHENKSVTLSFKTSASSD